MTRCMEDLERELANANARLRDKDVEISDLQYHLDTLRGKVPKRPWRWVKKYQMGGGNHWCLESVPQPDNGVGDGHDRTVGIVLIDHWSQHPTELMLFVQEELNRSSQRQEALKSACELAEYFRKYLPDLADHFRARGMSTAEVEVTILEARARKFLARAEAVK